MTTLLMLLALAGSDDTVFTESRVIDELHHVNQTQRSLGALAKQRGGSEPLRKLAEQLVSDHQKLDAKVLSYAKAHQLRVDEQGSRAEAGVSEEQIGDSKLTAPGAPGGSSSTNRSGSKTGTATPNSYSDKSQLPGAAYERSGSDPRTLADENVPKPKDDALRNLQGAEFDAKFLSDVVTTADRTLNRLQSWKGLGNKTLDALIDDGIKVLGTHRDRAQQLQKKVPVT
jgi:predicted outer membrane protein